MTSGVELPSREEAMMLWHPFRVRRYSPITEALMALEFPTEWPVLRSKFLDPAFPTSEGSTFCLEQRLERLSGFLQMALGAPSNSEAGAVTTTLLSLREQILPSPHFLIDDSLVQILEATVPVRDYLVR